MRGLRRRNDPNKTMAEINVTPLVDVMLVLLIIFMVTAPMLSMGIDVNLPRVKSKSVDVTEEKLVLTVTEAKEIYLNKTKMQLSELNSKLEAIFASRIDREVFLRADNRIVFHSPEVSLAPRTPCDLSTGLGRHYLPDHAE